MVRLDNVDEFYPHHAGNVVAERASHAFVAAALMDLSIKHSKVTNGEALTHNECLKPVNKITQ